jgi:hypothetical protein
MNHIRAGRQDHHSTDTLTKEQAMKNTVAALLSTALMKK